VPADFRLDEAEEFSLGDGTEKRLAFDHQSAQRTAMSSL